MNSRERVLAVFESKSIDRPPCWCGASAEFWEKAKKETGLQDEELLQKLGDDFRRVIAEYIGPVVPLKYKNATYRSVFGVERDGLGYGQPLHHPLAEATLHEINKYPKYYGPRRWVHCRCKPRYNSGRNTCRECTCNV